MPAEQAKEDTVAPHPIIMHVLWDDRSREVEAALTRRQLLAPLAEALDEDAAPACRHTVIVRALALLVSPFRLLKGEATGTSVR